MRGAMNGIWMKLKTGQSERVALRIAAIYASVGALWIFFSDRLLGVIANGPDEMTRISMFKGWFYVFATSALLYCLVKRSMNRIRRSEEALCCVEYKYQQLVQSANSVILQLDAQGTVTFANEYAKRFFGYSEEKLVGRSVLETILPVKDSRGRDTAEWISVVLEHPERYPNYQNENIRSNGEHVWVAWTNRAIRDSSGKITGLLCVGNDITERMHMQEDLRRARDELELRVRERTAELERSNQALQDFASIASHDMQEPLRKVISFGKRVKEKYSDSLGEDGNDYLERMLKATDRMQTLLKSLLEYSRVTTRAEPFREVELAAIVEEVISDLEVSLEKTGGEVRVGELPVIEADPTQMRQLFQNLIGNGLKFHKEGERPLIQVRGTTDGNGMLEIAFEDNGIGFEEKNLERIFAPFQRLHGRSSQYEGAGMGLAICRKIVERHGGSITARSEPGKGSTFMVSLPGKRKGAVNMIGESVNQ